MVAIKTNFMHPVERAYNLILKGISNIYNAVIWKIWFYSITYLVTKSVDIDSLF